MSDGEPGWPEDDEGYTDVGYLTDEGLNLEVTVGHQMDAFIYYMLDPDAEPRTVWALEELYGVRI